MEHGAGEFIFADPAAGARGSLRVFYFCPQHLKPDTQIVIAMHGFDRNASGFRDSLVVVADRLGLLVMVPEFDAEAFPTAHGYNYGNVRLPPPDGTLVPRDRWNFAMIDRLFEHVRMEQEMFNLFGLSAGAQYVLRYLALTEAPLLGAAVAANCGWYMLPDLGTDYPDGMGRIGLGETDLRRYLGQKLTVLLGDADTDANAHDLPRNAVALAQGPHRLARGLWHFEHCRDLAQRLGTAYGWTLEILPGAGHIDQVVYDRSAAILASVH